MPLQTTTEIIDIVIFCRIKEGFFLMIPIHLRLNFRIVEEWLFAIWAKALAHRRHCLL